MDDSARDLMRCLQPPDVYHDRTIESRRLKALEIIRNGVDIHSVRTPSDNDTFLHLAIKNNFVDVAELLLEQGIDVNAQNSSGETALHLSCSHKGCLCGCSINIDIQAKTELVPMLLYHGADPWILDYHSNTPFSSILVYKCIYVDNDDEHLNLLATIEHLYYYMFDQYTEIILYFKALIEMAVCKVPLFHETVENIRKVTFDCYVLAEDETHLFSMSTENLRLLTEKFDYILRAVLHSGVLNYMPRGWFFRKPENVYILFESNLQSELIEWLGKCNTRFPFLWLMFNDVPLASREQIVYYLLSYGMDIYEEDIETVYKYWGYNKLFKFLLSMDVKTESAYQMTELMPRLIFQVTGDIQQIIEDPQFWIRNMFELDFEPVLPYYAVPNLKDVRYAGKGKEDFFRKLLDQPQIPLLVEMARNAFRKYFIQRLRITSAKQFYNALELLPISSYHRKIIALETELY